MAFDVATPKIYVCSKCGKGFSEARTNFYKCYADIYKGSGFLGICKNCVNELYSQYLDECVEPRLATRAVCRKLGIYWSDDIFSIAVKKSTNDKLMQNYINQTNTVKYVGRSYDDTLREEGTLFQFGVKTPDADVKVEEDGTVEISEDIIAFWGPGYLAKDYIDLEQRRKYWMSKYPQEQVDVGTEALIRQICNLEIDINKQRAADKPIDKSVNSLNTLLGSLNLKPVQNNADPADADGKTPYGVWIRKLEDSRPVPDVDPELKDVDGLIRYIDVWYRGHAAKTFNIKNGYSEMYDKAMDELRVEYPEYEDEDDETLFNDIFGVSEDEEVFGGDSNE